MIIEEYIGKLEAKDKTLETIIIKGLNSNEQLKKLFSLLPGSNVKTLEIQEYMHDLVLFKELANAIKNTPLETFSLMCIAKPFRQIETLVGGIEGHTTLKTLELKSEGYYRTSYGIVGALKILENTAIEHLFLAQVSDNAAKGLAELLSKKNTLSMSLCSLDVNESRIKQEGTEELMKLWLYRPDLSIKGLYKHVKEVLESEEYRVVVKDFFEGKALQGITMLDDVTTNDRIYHINKIFKSFDVLPSPFIPELSEKGLNFNIISALFKSPTKSDISLAQHKLFDANIMKIIMEGVGDNNQSLKYLNLEPYTIEDAIQVLGEESKLDAEHHTDAAYIPI
jgi:hypothetical protein